MPIRCVLLMILTLSASNVHAGICEKVLSGALKGWSRIRTTQPSADVGAVPQNSVPLTRWISDDGQTYQVYITNAPYYGYFDIRARLTDHGILHFYFITRNNFGNLTTSLTGSDAFSEVMNFFGSRVRAIVSQWEWGTNLEKVNALTQGNQNALIDAAQETWSGRQAIKYGFSRLEIASFAGAPGTYDGLTVVFSKPNAPVTWSEIPEDERFIDFFHE